MCYYKHKSCLRGPVESNSRKEKSGFGVWQLISLCLAIQHLDAFHAFVSTFTCVWQGMHEDVWGSKGSQPFSNRTQLAGDKLFWLKNLTWTRRGMHITFKISLNLLECKKLHWSSQDFLRWRHCWYPFGYLIPHCLESLTVFLLPEQDLRRFSSSFLLLLFN